MLFSQIKLNFTDILAVAKEWLFHDYHGNNYFTHVKISEFAAGRPDVSYIIELSHMLHKHLLFQANNAQTFHFK